MSKRKRVMAEQKVAIVRRHLVENVPVSDLCDELGVHPNQYYGWQKQFFENGPAVFDQAGNGRKDSKVKTLERKVSALESKLASKDEVIAEIMESHVHLKKKLGQG